MKRLVLLAVWGISAWGSAHAQDAWTGQWIEAPWSSARDGAEVDGSHPLPVFRREFEVRGEVSKAELRIAGLGQWQGWLGDAARAEPVGPAGLHQAWTDYRKTVTYESYDVTRMLRPGRHALSFMLGNGMYNVQKSLMPDGKPRYTKFEGSFGPPKLIAELRLRYKDGRVETLGTDAQWSVRPGPVTFDSTYGGEDFDARRLETGWNLAGSDDRDWVAAQVMEGPGGTLVAAIAPEVTESASHEPVKKSEPSNGRTVYDLGQNFAGVPHIRVSGGAGSRVKLTPGELLNPDGTVTQRGSGGPVWWSYTLAGTQGGETWEPMFGFYGFRYVQVEWTRSSGKMEEIAGREWHSRTPETGTFASSDPMLNAIHGLIVNAMHNNEMTILTDCPQREKLGWLEESHIVAAGLMFNDDLKGLYRATALNIADAQRPDGMVPTTAPMYSKFGGDFGDSPEWGSAAILAAWKAYGFYGDKTELERNYAAMQRYIAYLEKRAVDGIVAYGLGDWYDIGPGAPGKEKNTSLGVTGTLMLYEDADAMRKIAVLLGHAEDAKRYGALAERESAAFNRRFWDEKAGWYDRGSQTANAMPLGLGVVPEARRAAVLAHVVADIHAHDDHVTTGEIGYPYLLRALMQAGGDDLLLAMMRRKDAPSYGAQLAAGATSLTEAWDANPTSSQDHFMLGGAEEWFYRELGGIDFDLSRDRADERITIRPDAAKGLEWVRCGFQSRLGKIESDWKTAGGITAYEVTVPAEATVILPAKAVPVGKRIQGTENGGETVYRVKAGSYRFTVR
jgi:alpha-L-rhamnosidase